MLIAEYRMRPAPVVVVVASDSIPLYVAPISFGVVGLPAQSLQWRLIRSFLRGKPVYPLFFLSGK